MPRMMHSSPRPLKIAIDLIKRLRPEIERNMTAEQLRDLARLERLINEAQRAHDDELVLTRHRAKTEAAPPPPPPRKRIWGRISSIL